MTEKCYLAGKWFLVNPDDRLRLASTLCTLFCYFISRRTYKHKSSRQLVLYTDLFFLDLDSRRTLTGLSPETLRLTYKINIFLFLASDVKLEPDSVSATRVEKHMHGLE